MGAPPDRGTTGPTAIAGPSPFLEATAPQLLTSATPCILTEVGVATHGRPPDHGCPFPSPRPTRVHDGLLGAVGTLARP